MKHKVGDKVRVKSKEWWEAQPKSSGSVKCGCESFTQLMTPMCGNIVEICDILEDTYSIKGDYHNWTDEMFEDEAPHTSETLLQDIANVIKTHNMGVQVSEEDGKLIIEPLKVDEDDLPIDTPVMVADANSVDTFILRYYAGNGKVFCAGEHDAETEGTCHYDIIIPWDKFDPKDLGESMKFNIVK